MSTHLDPKTTPLADCPLPPNYNVEKNIYGLSNNPADKETYNKAYALAKPLILQPIPAEDLPSPPPVKASKWKFPSLFKKKAAEPSVAKEDKKEVKKPQSEMSTEHIDKLFLDAESSRLNKLKNLPNAIRGEWQWQASAIKKKWDANSKLKNGLMIAGVIAVLAIIAFAIAYGVGYAQNAAWVNTMNDALKQAYTSSSNWVQSNWQYCQLGVAFVAGAVASVLFNKASHMIKSRRAKPALLEVTE